MSSNPAESTEASADSSAPLVPPSATALPKAIILGFSKGGTVVNQIIAELAHWKPVSAGTMMNGGKPFPQLFHETRDHTCPVSKDELPSSIAEIHYLDVGLNSAGAYLTDSTVIGKAVENLLANHIRARFTLHGTPKQWCDKNRSWIRKERDRLLQLLNEEANRCEGKLQVTERFYFANMPSSLQMHFEIIENIDIS